MNIFDLNVERYDSWFNIHNIIYKNELKMLSSFIKEDLYGIEIGVGTGRFASELGTRIGIDISLNMLRIARRRGVEVIYANGERMPFKDSLFDYVSMIVTICFLEDPYKVLRESHRVLSDGGRVYIAFIERNSKYGIYYHKNRQVSPFYVRANFYTVQEIEDMLKKTGFMIEGYAQTLFHEPGVEIEEEWEYGYDRGSFVLVIGEKSGDHKDLKTH
ncbi:MAG: SAM-dependent methyltransferase [Aciduliprofundum sp.]|nr:MAG: SAM-dependent methyltransferase [Aciduliprofundum sp.]